MSFVLQTLNIFVDAFSLILSIRVIMSWLLWEHRNMLSSFIWDCTEPVLKPIRNMLPAMRVDFSPLIVIFLLRWFQDWINIHF